MHTLTLISFILFFVAVVMFVIPLANPLRQPRVLPIREEVPLTTDPIVKITGTMVITAVIVFFIIFR